LKINIRQEVLFIILLGLFGLPTGLHATGNWEYSSPSDVVPNSEEQEWQEQGAKLPPFPQEQDLVDLRLDYPGSRFSYFLDSESLKIGNDDVIRYTLVIRSSSGAGNVMFEGMHCNEKTYKTYGYNTGKGTLQAARNPKWRPIREVGSRPYRNDIWRHYFCFVEDDLQVRDREAILRAIKYPDRSRINR